MKKYILTILLLVVALAGHSQSSAEAKAILDKSYQSYEASKGIRIEFTFAVVENNTTQVQQNGLAMVKGNKFKIEAEGVETWFDGKTQWILMKDYDEVNISEPTSEDLASISPTALLGMYKSGFNIDKPIAKTVNGKKVSKIKLTPTSTRSEFDNILVSVDTSSHALVQIILTLKNGVKNKIDIKSYNTNYNYADTDFIFNKSKYPKVEIIDLR